MKSTIRHETSLFPVMDFFFPVMKSKSRHEIILRHEWLHDGMKSIIFRDEILYQFFEFRNYPDAYLSKTTNLRLTHTASV